MVTLERRHGLITVLKPHFLLKRLRVLPTSRMGYHAGKPIESVVYCLSSRVHTQNDICNTRIRSNPVKFYSFY